MIKREFIKKASLLSASMLAVHSLGFGKNALNINPAIKVDGSSAPIENLLLEAIMPVSPLKGPLVKMLKAREFISLKMVGSFNPDPVDFPDIALLLAEEIKSGPCRTWNNGMWNRCRGCNCL